MEIDKSFLGGGFGCQSIYDCCITCCILQDTFCLWFCVHTSALVIFSLVYKFVETCRYDVDEQKIY